jgi:mono/diheme cytochrome c family protein
MIPRPLIYIALILISLSLVPMACILKNWHDPAKSSPRIQINPDMDQQPRFKAQAANPFFADGRAMRAWPEGTVPRGLLRDDERFHFALEPDSSFTESFPLPVTEALLARGQERYDIFCATCHGLGGLGDGMTHRRAEQLGQGTWIPPTDLTSEIVIERSHGHLYNSIANGIRTMPAYGHQIPPADRWAIVAYLRALQRARHATLEDVPEEHRRGLR